MVQVDDGVLKNGACPKGLVRRLAILRKEVVFMDSAYILKAILFLLTVAVAFITFVLNTK